MTATLVRLVVVASVAVLVSALALTMLDDNRDQASLSPYVFSEDRGDPVTVWVSGEIDGDSKCTNIAGVGYATTVACFARSSAYRIGAYSLIIPVTEGRSPLVVGVVPMDATEATVRVREERVRSEMRGRWFLARLKPGELGPDNDVPFSVDFK